MRDKGGHNITYDDDLWEALTQRAKEEGTSRTRLIHEGIELRLAQPRAQVGKPPVLKARKPIQSAQEFGEANREFLTVPELQKRARSGPPAQGQTFDYSGYDPGREGGDRTAEVRRVVTDDGEIKDDPFWPRPEEDVQLGQLDADPPRFKRDQAAVPVSVVDLPPNTTPEQAGEQMKKAMAIAQKAGVALGREFHPVPKPSAAKRTRR